MKIKKFRDLTLIDINEKQRLVIACDSSGGIGIKDDDLVKVSPMITGYFTATVVMLELLSYGAKPLTLINNLSVEMDPTGKDIIKGIEKALDSIVFNNENFITGTTEENIPVTTTAMGLTAIGLIDLEVWERPRSEKGDFIVLIGIPKVGNEVKEDKGKTNVTIERLLKIKDKNFIGEILPVGSKGIEYEINEMCKTNRLDYRLFYNIEIDLNKSAGPSTCVLISLKEDRVEELSKCIDIPVHKLGVFI